MSIENEPRQSEKMEEFHFLMTIDIMTSSSEGRIKETTGCIWPLGRTLPALSSNHKSTHSFASVQNFLSYCIVSGSIVKSFHCLFFKWININVGPRLCPSFTFWPHCVSDFDPADLERTVSVFCCMFCKLSWLAAKEKLYFFAEQKALVFFVFL